MFLRNDDKSAVLSKNISPTNMIFELLNIPETQILWRSIVGGIQMRSPVALVAAMETAFLWSFMYMDECVDCNDWIK